MSLPQLAVGNTCDYPTCLANGLTVAIAARPPLAYMARILIEPRAHSITHLDFELRSGFLFQEKVLHFYMRRRASTRLLFLPQERYKRLQRHGHLLSPSKDSCCLGCPRVPLQHIHAGVGHHLKHRENHEAFIGFSGYDAKCRQ